MKIEIQLLIKFIRYWNLILIVELVLTFSKYKEEKESKIKSTWKLKSKLFLDIKNDVEI